MCIHRAEARGSRSRPHAHGKALHQVSVPVAAGVVPGWVHLTPFAVDLYGVPGMAVAGDADVGDARCVKELGVDALVALWCPGGA